MTKKSNHAKKVVPVHFFEVGKVYRGSDKKLYKVVANDGTSLTVAKKHGCVYRTKEPITAKLRVHLVTKSQQIYLTKHGAPEYLNAASIINL